VEGHSEKSAGDLGIEPIDGLMQPPRWKHRSTDAAKDQSSAEIPSRGFDRLHASVPPEVERSAHDFATRSTCLKDLRPSMRNRLLAKKSPKRS